MQSHLSPFRGQKGCSALLCLSAARRASLSSYGSRGPGKGRSCEDGAPSFFSEVRAGMSSTAGGGVIPKRQPTTCAAANGFVSAEFRTPGWRRGRADEKGGKIVGCQSARSYADCMLASPRHALEGCFLSSFFYFEVQVCTGSPPLPLGFIILPRGLSLREEDQQDSETTHWETAKRAERCAGIISASKRREEETVSGFQIPPEFAWRGKR
ncbi:hypothetical protein LZ30DRAFT_742212 [Colletotrichum cereale]|nr:hypothetical protein LZ30DRAFT_742212 [Colletotrichum cereale]